MPKGILCERRRLVFGSVVLEKLFGCLLDRFPLLFVGFFFDDLAVALLQPLTLAALRRDRLLLVSGASRTAASAPVQFELVMIESAVLENAHVANFAWTPFMAWVAGTV